MKLSFKDNHIGHIFLGFCLCIIALWAFSCHVSKPRVLSRNVPHRIFTPILGVNTSGSYFQRSCKYGQKSWVYPAYSAALKDLGIDYLDEADTHLEFYTGSGYQQNRKRTMSQLDSYFTFLRKNDLRFVWNLNNHAWVERAEFEQGKNFYEPEPGMHYTKMPSDILEKCVQSGLFIGVNYDELEHGQLSCSAFAQYDSNGVPIAELPALGDTTGMSYEEAYDFLFKKALGIAEYYRQRGAICSVEFV
ncbi:MAG TPA: hypothetical protein VIJ25_01810, partial [Methylococcales bacterium]